MAVIRPFKGIRYNQQKINNLADVICPPYDIISPQRQDELYSLSKYNFVRIEYNRELPQDDSQDNRYTRAANNLSQWLNEDILQTDAEPSFYIHEHHFCHQGKEYKRRNIIACVKLEEWEKKVVRPHENISPRAKSDRLSMLYACRANTSPVLSMFEDPQNVVSLLLKSAEHNVPLIDIFDSNREHHIIRALADPEVVKGIQQELLDRPLYIADGHHRYDSALAYRRERIPQSVSVFGEEGFNFIMMSLVDFADPGLIILPPHRMVRGISKPTLTSLKSQLKVFFDIEDLSIDSPDIWPEVDKLLTGMRPNMHSIRLAVFGLEPNRMLILTLRDHQMANQLMPAFHSDLYKKLDVSLVDHVILEKLLAFDKEKEEITLAYCYDRLDAVNRVKDLQYQLVFILNPIKPALIKAIADSGDRMPRKSTYFYPKSPAGLVFYKW
jgi:uncharacterized protein (DUF1015 family)